MKATFQVKSAREGYARRFIHSKKPRVAAAILMPLAAGFATFKLSDNLRIRELNAKKLQLKADLKSMQRESTVDISEMSIKLSKSLMSNPETRSDMKNMQKEVTNMQSGVKEDILQSQKQIKITMKKLNDDPALVNQAQSLFMDGVLNALSAKKNVKAIEIELQSVNARIEAQHTTAKVDGIIGGGIVLLPIAIWMLFRKVRTAVREFRDHLQGTIEDLKTLRQMKSEGVSVPELLSAAKEAKNSGERKEPKRPSKPPVKEKKEEKPQTPEQMVQHQLYEVLYPMLGDITGKVAKCIVESLGMETAEEIVKNPDSIISILEAEANQDKLRKALSGKSISLETVLSNIHECRKRKENGKTQEEGKLADQITDVNAKEIEKLREAVDKLHTVKIGGGFKTSELLRIITALGFSIRSQGRTAAHHHLIFYGDEIVRSEDGRKRSFPNPKDEVEPVAVKEVIDACIHFLEERIERMTTKA